MGLKINITSGAEMARVLDKDRGPIAQLLLDSRKVFLLALLLTLVTQAASTAPIVYMSNMFDRVVPSRSEVTLVSLTVLLVAVYLFDNSVDWLRRRLLMRFALRLDWDLSSPVFDAAFRRFAGRKRVNVQQTMGDLVELRKFFQGQGFITLIDAPYAFVFVGICYIVHPWLALFALVSVVLMSFFAILKARSMAPLIRQANQAAAETNRSVAESLRHSETALALGMQTAIRSRWYKRHQADLVVDANGHEASGLVGGIAALLTRAMPQLAMGFAIYLSIHGELSTGSVIASLFLVRRTIGPLQALVNHWPKMVKARLAMDRLEELIAADEPWQDKMQLPQPKGELDVERLNAHSPDGRRQILTDINFSLRPGQVLTIVGASAAGKSTLARHLVGILKPTSGSVRLDGAEIHDWIRSESVPHLGYVPQDVLVLEGTVAENIARMGEVNSEAVVRAAELVDLHKTILSFPQGYDTRLGDGGFVLTGGQKQRLIIARALYGDPKLVVMDEPSSSLDADSEEALLRLIRILKRSGSTLVLTSHRPNLVSAADFVLVLDAGEQKAFGPTSQFGGAALEVLRAKRQSVVAARQLAVNSPQKRNVASRTSTDLAEAKPLAKPAKVVGNEA